LVSFVSRIFLTLAVLSTVFLLVALGMGLMIGDAAARDPATQGMVRNHLMVAMGGLIFAMAVHALVLTYFMGTGRWMEETCTAYRLPPAAHTQSQGLKYRTLPLMMLAVVLLLLTGALGAAADPASPVEFGLAGLSASTLHFVLAALATGVHVVVTLYEFLALARNAELVEEIMVQVRRIRLERGLPV
jgi:hypothetical protein